MMTRRIVFSGIGAGALSSVLVGAGTQQSHAAAGPAELPIRRRRVQGAVRHREQGFLPASAATANGLCAAVDRRSVQDGAQDRVG